mmetsp:Transcript_4152/g.15193  ORF Transcript_4152/g.15193 Transcript_4152/m.15193 type:complete len:296 (-) Transcript_4152:436-1323(-)
MPLISAFRLASRTASGTTSQPMTCFAREATHKPIVPTPQNKSKTTSVLLPLNPHASRIICTNCVACAVLVWKKDADESSNFTPSSVSTSLFWPYIALTTAVGEPLDLAFTPRPPLTNFEFRLFPRRSSGSGGTDVCSTLTTCGISEISRNKSASGPNKSSSSPAVVAKSTITDGVPCESLALRMTMLRNVPSPVVRSNASTLPPKRVNASLVLLSTASASSLCNKHPCSPISTTSSLDPRGRNPTTTRAVRPSVMRPNANSILFRYRSVARADAHALVFASASGSNPILVNTSTT